jgi:hypothetical protein
MQYDLNLGAYGSQRLEVNGRFFKYVSGTGKIRVTTNKGAVIDLAVGQGVWGEEFSALTVQDKSGAANQGVLLAGSYDFRDDSVLMTGSVNVGNLNQGYATSAMHNAVLAATATAEIIPAATNVRGVHIARVHAYRDPAAGWRMALMAKVGATPAASGDTDATADILAYFCSTGVVGEYENNTGIIVPAGRSIYWANNGAAIGTIKSVQYTVL